MSYFPWIAWWFPWWMAAFLSSVYMSLLHGHTVFARLWHTVIFNECNVCVNETFQPKLLAGSSNLLWKWAVHSTTSMTIFRYQLLKLPHLCAIYENPYYDQSVHIQPTKKHSVLYMMYIQWIVQVQSGFVTYISPYSNGNTLVIIPYFLDLRPSLSKIPFEINFWWVNSRKYGILVFVSHEHITCTVHSTLSHSQLTNISYMYAIWILHLIQSI